MPEKFTNADKQIGSYSLLWVILFWVIVANYSQDEADADGLKYYWNYEKFCKTCLQPRPNYKNQ